MKKFFGRFGIQAKLPKLVIRKKVPMPQSLIIENARIYTMDREVPHAGALPLRMAA